MPSAPEVARHDSDRTLVVVTPVAAVLDAESVTIDDKLYSGLLRYQEQWGGRLTVLTPVSTDASAYSTRRPCQSLPFRILPFDLDDPAVRAILQGADCILAAADDHRQLSFWQSTTRPLIYIIEYTLRTRLQQIAATRTTLARKLKTTIWTLREELRLRRALRHATGVQCNGTPAHAAYRHLNRQSLLYFDTRMRDDLMIDQTLLAAKIKRIQAGKALRLAYSGRLETIKGAHHLVSVAILLRRRNVDFTLDVFGTGSLFDEMQREVGAGGLEPYVKLHGAIDFEQELVPTLCRTADLFLCCHLQDDPSCTYLETLACGVPIAAYRNLAFEGVLGLGDVGAMTTARTPQAMARLVEELDADRPRLAMMMGAAADVGRSHSFESVFDDRIRQIKTLSGSA
jgi:colanic acid/amylovoran biosynthesis glycosyltransferase